MVVIGDRLLKKASDRKAEGGTHCLQEHCMIGDHEATQSAGAPANGSVSLLYQWMIIDTGALAAEFIGRSIHAQFIGCVPGPLYDEPIPAGPKRA